MKKNTTIELKPAGKKDKYLLYINGKTDSKEYYNECGIFVNETPHDAPVLKKIWNISSSDFPEKIKMYSDVVYSLKNGRICNIEISRKTKSFQVGLAYLLSEEEILTMNLNPIKLGRLVMKNAIRKGFNTDVGCSKHWENLHYMEYMKVSPTKGTIRDNLEKAVKLLTQIVASIEKEMEKEICE